MKVNLDIYEFREVQNFRTLLATAVADGIVDIPAFSEYLDRYIVERHKLLTIDRKKIIKTAEDFDGLNRDYTVRENTKKEKFRRGMATRERIIQAEKFRSHPDCPECSKGRLLPSKESTAEEVMMVCFNCRYSELWERGTRPEKYGLAPNADKIERLEQEQWGEFMAEDLPSRGEV